MFALVLTALAHDAAASGPDLAAPEQHRVVLQPGRGWRESDGERWTLVAPGGTVVCEIPCEAMVTTSSGYAVHGQRLVYRRTGAPVVVEGIHRRLELPPTPGHPETSFVARMTPPRGDPSGAMATAIVSGALLVVAALVLISWACESEPPGPSACGVVNPPLYRAQGTIGAVALGSGIVVGGIALALASGSSWAKLEVTPIPAVAPVKVSLGLSGIRGSF
jgi:hypothetical protein